MQRIPARVEFGYAKPRENGDGGRPGGFARWAIPGRGVKKLERFDNLPCKQSFNLVDLTSCFRAEVEPEINQAVDSCEADIPVCLHSIADRNVRLIFEFKEEPP
jgi:hypothetical protein